MTSELADASARAPRACDPIAIVGISCRLPQAPDPDAFWRLLRDGRSAIGQVPADRWALDELAAADPGWAAHDAIRFGGFLDQIDGFDPEFFGISPREAAAMDPQQRLMLELSWEALEDAAIIPAQLCGRPAGVFVGAISDDYARLTHQQGPGVVSQFSFTGAGRAIIANGSPTSWVPGAPVSPSTPPSPRRWSRCT